MQMSTLFEGAGLLNRPSAGGALSIKLNRLSIA